MISKLKQLRKNYLDMPVQIKASIWFTGCSIINKAVQFLTTPIFTRLMTADEYGLYTVFLSWQSIILMIVGLNISSNIFYNMLIKDKESPDRIISSIMGLVTCIGLILVIAFCIFHDSWMQLIQLPASLIVCLILTCILTVSFELWAVKLRFIYQYKKLVLVTASVLILNPLMGLYFVLNYESDKGIARCFSVIVSTAIVYGIIYIIKIIKGKIFYNKEYWIYALSMAVPLLPHYLSQTLLNQSDRIMISFFDGNGEAAIYGIAHSVAILMLFVNKSINDSFIAWFYKRLETKNYKNISQISSKLILLIGSLNIILMLMAPELLHILATEEYEAAVYVIPPLAVSSYLIFIYGLFCNIEFYFEMKIPMMVVSVAGAALNIVLNYFLIPHFGFIAAGYTTLVSYIVFVICHYIIMRKAQIKYMNSINVFNVKFIVIFTIVLIGLSFLVNLVYTFVGIRYLVLFIILFSIVNGMIKYGNIKRA